MPCIQWDQLESDSHQRRRDPPPASKPSWHESEPDRRRLRVRLRRLFPSDPPPPVSSSPSSMSTLSNESPGHSHALSYKSGTDWPHLSQDEIVAIVAVNVGSLLAAWILLRVWWKPPSRQELQSVEAQQPARPDAEEPTANPLSPLSPPPFVPLSRAWSRAGIAMTWKARFSPFRATTAAQRRQAPAVRSRSCAWRVKVQATIDSRGPRHSTSCS